MGSLGQIMRSTYKRRGFRKGVIEKLTFKWTMKLMEVRFEQMELRQRISDAKKRERERKRA